MIKNILIIDILWTLIFALMLFSAVIAGDLVLFGISVVFLFMAVRGTLKTYRRYKNI